MQGFMKSSLLYVFFQREGRQIDWTWSQHLCLDVFGNYHYIGPTILRACQLLSESERRKEKHVSARFYSSVILGYSYIGQVFLSRLKFAEINKK